MSKKLLLPLIGLALSFSASGAGLGFNPFQKSSSPTSPTVSPQKLPPVTVPSPNTQPSKPTAPISVPAVKPDAQSKK
jgi:hypothetical protein